MARTFWQSLRNLFRAQADSANKAISDAARDGEFAIKDSEVEVVKFRQAIAQQMAANASVKRELESEQAAEAKWAKVAAAAARAGNEADARTALIEKANLASRVNTLSKQVANNEASIAATRKELTKAENKINRAKSDFAQLKARKHSAEIKRSLSEATAKFGGSNSPLAALDDLQKTVESLEDEAAAADDLGSSETTVLSEKYETASTQSIEDELAALMATSASK